jgi:hypothetical protein
MKYLKKFNESVIKPHDFTEAFTELKSIPEVTMDDLNRIFNPLNVEFVDVDYFKSKLQTKKEIELVPVNMPHIRPGLRFAAHNVYTNKMYVCIVEDKFLNNFKNYRLKEEMLELLEEILRHESIHKQQAEKRPGVTLRNLENSPLKPKSYFSSTDEIMAYADSFITQCRNKGLSNEEILDLLKTGKRVSWIQSVYKDMDPDVQKRFKKYVYQYISDENN